MDTQLQKKPWYIRYKFPLAGTVVLVILIVSVMMVTRTGTRFRTGTDHLVIGEAEAGKFMEYAEVEGVVHPIMTIKINSQESGSIERIVAEEGMMLSPGDTILVLSNPDLLRSIGDQADEWDKQRIGFREKQIEMEQKSISLQKQTLQAIYELNRLQKSYALDEEEFKMGIKSKAQLEVQRDEYEYKTRSTALQLESLRQDSTATELKQELMKNDLERERKKYLRMLERLDNLAVRVLSAGQLSYIKVTPGQQVQASETIAEVNILDQLKVTTLLNEYYIDRITAGLPGTITWQNIKYPLRITKVVPEVKDRQFEVDLVFTGEMPDNARVGKSFRVQLELGQPEDAVIIPRGDFFQHTGGQWIYKLNGAGNRAVRTPVTIGRQNPMQYEITSGLVPGDKVIVTGYGSLGNSDILILR